MRRVALRATETSPTLAPMARSNVQKPRGLSALLIATLCAFAGALITTTSPAEAGPQARAAASCSIKSPPNDGYPGSGYLLRLTVTKISCAKGKSIMRSQYSCRMKKGKKGRCTSKVQGYTCTERRKNVIATQFDAQVTCKRGSKKVVFFYQQNT